MNVFNTPKAASYAAVSFGSFLAGSAVLNNRVENPEKLIEIIIQLAGFYLLAVGFVSALASHHLNKR